MKNKNHLIVLTFVFSGACVLSSPPPRNSRFKVDITSMTKVDFYHDSWVYQNPKKRMTEYDKFIIAPVVVYENPVKKIRKEDRPVYQAEGDLLTAELKTLIGGTYPLANEPGPTTARMEMEVVDIKPVVTLIKDGNLVRSSDPTTKGTKLELNCYDTVTGELVYGLSTLYKGEEYLAYEDTSLLPEIDKVFSEWSKFFKNRFDHAMTDGKK